MTVITALRHLVLFLLQLHLEDSVSKIQQRFPAKAEAYVPTKSLIKLFHVEIHLYHILSAFMASFGLVDIDEVSG